MIKEIRVTPASPIHLPDRHTVANYSSTLHYIPGSTVRGALAGAYLQKVNIQQEVNQRLQGNGLSFRDYFDWLFLSGQVRFPNLYPMKTSQRPLVIPLSARSCKRFRGFRDEGRSVWEKHHGVIDILLNEPEDEAFRCKICDSPIEPLEPISGFYESDDGQVNGAQRIKVNRRMLVRTAIENETEIVRQKFLYSLETLEEGELFVGNLMVSAPNGWASNDAQEAMKILMEHLQEPLSRLWIGGDKTRGLGAIHLELSEFEPPDLLPSLENRFNQLQDAWKRVPEHENTNIFTLTLNSDAIVMDELWRYHSILDVDVLAREAPGAPPCCLKRWFTGTRIVSGWNAAHGLPKEDELAILKGSAFLYHTTAEQDMLLPWLRRLEEEGIGERLSEGFGQVIACHPLHWEVPQ